MRRVARFGLAVATAAAIGGCGGRLPQPPPPATTPLEARGRHLVRIASGCGCHGANFAGWREGGPDALPRSLPFGERFVGPFGVVPASNITPDRASGIGLWSDGEVRRAITEGIVGRGDAAKRLHPLMSYHAYRGMARSDLDALVAYLRRLRPVDNGVPTRELKTPVPQTPVADAAPPGPAEPPTEGVALGRYLVRHVSVCADCHSPGEPGDSAGGPELSGKTLRLGGRALVAPNLTPDRETGLGRWSEGDIARYLRTGSRPDGGLAQSAMAGLILSSYSHYTPEEARAVAAYLKSLAPVRSTVRGS